MSGDDQRGYRKERPLSEIIPPDHRRIKTAALVVGGMIAGATLLSFVQWTRQVRIPAFSGAPVRVGKSFVVGPQR